jgi:glycerate-2-kinase
LQKREEPRPRASKKRRKFVMRNSTKIITAVRSSFSRLQQLKNVKLLHHNHCSTMNTFIKPCLDSFKTTLEEINPSFCVQNALHLQGNQLIINERTYFLDKNVYLIAIGKAAIGMVEGAEQILDQHLIAGIASIPDGARIPEKSSTLFLRGAKDNLPDERSLHNSKQIEEFINEVKMKAGENANKQIILVY